MHDLDLSLTMPDGTVLYPNGKPGADGDNNVEKLTWLPPGGGGGDDDDAALAGNWTLTVTAHALIEGTQAFAVTLAGGALVTGALAMSSWDATDFYVYKKARGPFAFLHCSCLARSRKCCLLGCLGVSQGCLVCEQALAACPLVWTERSSSESGPRVSLRGGDHPRPLPPPTTRAKICLDYSANCSDWKARGWCTNESVVGNVCDRSCNNCTALSKGSSSAGDGYNWGATAMYGISGAFIVLICATVTCCLFGSRGKRTRAQEGSSSGEPPAVEMASVISSAPAPDNNGEDGCGVFEEAWDATHQQLDPPTGSAPPAKPPIATELLTPYLFCCTMPGEVNGSVSDVQLAVQREAANERIRI